MDKEHIYMQLNKKPENEIEWLIHNIMRDVAGHLNAYYDKAYAENEPTFSSRQLVVMVSTNVMVNLIQSSIKETITPAQRLELMVEAMTDIAQLSMHLWKAIETNKAPESNAN
jgi:hypothetical protein